MKIIHFAPDDKFLPFIQKTFEQAFPGKNEYRVPGTTSEAMEFVLPGKNVRRVADSYWTGEVKNELLEFDCLIVHYMNPFFVEGISRAHPALLTMWSTWGGDYYSLIEKFRGGLLLPATSRLALRLRRAEILRRTVELLTNPAKLKSYIHGKLAQRTGRHSRRSVSDVIGRIDLLWATPEDRDAIEMALPAFKGSYHRICYYSAEEVFSAGPDEMSGPDILVGNSATATNNHLEIFDTLKGLDLDGRKLVVPLSYGDSNYADAIVRAGERSFGNRFVPLRTYMPRGEYYQVISSCGIVIMNHVRQQAGTTIATALYKGASVYMRNENTLGTFYRSMGINILSVQDDLGRRGEAFKQVSREDVINHKRILGDYWGHEEAVKAARGLEVYLKRRRKQG